MKAAKLLVWLSNYIYTFVKFSQNSHIIGLWVYVLARERMPRHNLFWQAKLSPQCSHLIFMEIFQRFDYFSLEDYNRQESAMHSERASVTARCQTAVHSQEAAHNNKQQIIHDNEYTNKTKTRQ